MRVVGIDDDEAAKEKPLTMAATALLTTLAKNRRLRLTPSRTGHGWILRSGDGSRPAAILFWAASRTVDELLAKGYLSEDGQISKHEELNS